MYNFGVSAKVEKVSVGPSITRYELRPAEGVRVSKIAKLSDDIALNLAAESIRIEAPIPGKQAVGIEVPNKENEIVHFREIIESDAFINAESKLSMALGKDVAGEPVVTDIAKMPHVLIAGSTGSDFLTVISVILSLIFFAYSVALCLPGIAVTVRRLRDAGYNWPYIFVTFIINLLKH